MHGKIYTQGGRELTQQLTWNLATQLELQKLYSIPSGIVAWYWGKEFRLQKWQTIPIPKRKM